MACASLLSPPQGRLSVEGRSSDHHVTPAETTLQRPQLGLGESMKLPIGRFGDRLFSFTAYMCWSSRSMSLGKVRRVRSVNRHFERFLHSLNILINSYDPLHYQLSRWPSSILVPALEDSALGPATTRRTKRSRVTPQVHTPSAPAPQLPAFGRHTNIKLCDDTQCSTTK